jgi:hypothetical protein
MRMRAWRNASAAFAAGIKPELSSNCPLKLSGIGDHICVFVKNTQKFERIERGVHLKIMREMFSAMLVE